MCTRWELACTERKGFVMVYQNELFSDEGLEVVKENNEADNGADLIKTVPNATMEEVKKAFSLCRPISTDALFTPIFNSNSVNIFTYLSQKILTALKKNTDGKRTLRIQRKCKDLHIKYRMRTEIADSISLDGRSAQFLWYLIAKFAMMTPPNATEQQIANNSIIVFRQSEVANIFGISPQHARLVVKDAYITLKAIEGEFSEELPGIDIRDWHFSPLSSMVETRRFGYVGIRLNADFVQYLAHTNYKYLPIGILRIAPKKNPNSLAFAIKLVSNYNINCVRNQAQSKIVSVETLLGVATNLPKKEEVEKAGGRLHYRIIRPFVRDLDNLQKLGIITNWCFVWKTFNNVVPKDCKNITFDDFLNLNVYYEIPKRQSQPKVEYSEDGTAYLVE